MKHIFILLIALFSFSSLQSQVPKERFLRMDDTDLQLQSADDQSSMIFNPYNEHKKLKKKLDKNKEDIGTNWVNIGNNLESINQIKFYIKGIIIGLTLLFITITAISLLFMILVKSEIKNLKKIIRNLY